MNSLLSQIYTKYFKCGNVLSNIKQSQWKNTKELFIGFGQELQGLF